MFCAQGHEQAASPAPIISTYNPKGNTAGLRWMLMPIRDESWALHDIRKIWRNAWRQYALNHCKPDSGYTGLGQTRKSHC